MQSKLFFKSSELKFNFQGLTWSNYMSTSRFTIFWEIFIYEKKFEIWAKYDDQLTLSI